MSEFLTAEDVGAATTGFEIPPAIVDNIAGGWRDAETPVAAKTPVARSKRRRDDAYG
jgi:hypothetical protein